MIRNESVSFCFASVQYQREGRACGLRRDRFILLEGRAIILAQANGVTAISKGKSRGAGKTPLVPRPGASNARTSTAARDERLTTELEALPVGQPLDDA
jgi:hypothetical protein